MAYLGIYKGNEIVLKKKKPLTQLIIPQSPLSVNSFADYADRHQFGKVNLSTGNVSKFSYPSFIRHQIICICALHESNGNNFCVIGLLNSGELFLYNAGIKSLYIIQGPSNLMIPDEYKSKTQSMSNLQTLHTFAKHFFDKSDCKSIEVEAIKKESDEEIFFSFRPTIFASPDLSKVFLIGSYSKICLWQRTFGMYPLEGKVNNFKGFWKIFSAPADQPFPTKMNRAKLCEFSFITKGPTGPLCYIYFGFMTDDLIVLSTLVVSWNAWVNPCSSWKQIKIPLKNIEVKANISNRKGALLARASHESSSLLLCLNTSAAKFYLIYVSAERESFTSVVSVLYPSVSRGTDSRKHWVVACNWSVDNSFVIGCLKSGHVFISTRMGNLLQIYCRNLPLLSEPTIFLPLIEDFDEKDFKGSDLSESSNEISVTSRPKFSILSNLPEVAFMIFSGIRVFFFKFPKDLRNEKEVSSFLLKQSHLSNHELQRLCSEHQYDYIHCSSWRLARSLLNLNQREKSEDQQAKNSLQLWLPGSLPEQNAADSFPLTDLERQMTETFKFIQSSWAFLSSSIDLSQKQKRSLTGAAISETLKLLEIILVASPVAGDHEEHQVRLIQTLRLFHQIIKTVEVNACSRHMIKPILKLTTKYFRLVLSSAKNSSEMKLAYILVLTQTLVSVERTLDQRNVFIFHRTRKLWFCLYKCTTPLWKQSQHIDAESFHRKLRSVTGIIQRRVLHLREFRTCSVDREFKILLGGNLKSGIQKLMEEIVKILKSSCSRRKLKKYISYGFYSLVINNDLRALVEFVRWCFEQLSEIYEISKGKSDESMEGRLQNIMQSIFGNLGILIAKSLLTSSPSLLKNSTSIPPELSEDFRGIQLEEPSSITLTAAIFCLIIGDKWNSVYFFANAFGDTKLSLFAALLSSNQNGRSRAVDVLEGAILPYLRTDNLSYEVSDYKTIQDLLQAASMLEIEILTSTLDECVERIGELLPELPLPVHEDFKLPSPPWFCPQFEMDEVHGKFNDDWINEVYSCHKEILIRREISVLVYLFTLLISASGLTSLFIDYELEELKENFPEDFETDLNYSSFRVKRLDRNELQSNNAWKDLLSTWKKFLGLVRLLQLRDKVSIQLREWSLIKVNITQVSTLQEGSWKLLKLCYETFRFQNNNSWRHDLLRIILTAAFDAPPTVETVNIVAAVVSQMKPVPSLMKQKLDYLLEFWKKIKLKTNERSHEKEAPSLLEYFECQFGNVFNSEIASWPKFENFEDQIEAFVSFISMTLLKLDKSFETTEIPYPFLCQYGPQIRELESSCARLVKNLINYTRYRNDENTVASTQDSSFSFVDQILSKKGFFKNSNAYAGNWDKLGVAIFYVGGDTFLFPTQHRSRRHSTPFLKGKKRTFKKRRSISLNSAGEGTIRQEVKLKLVSLRGNGSSHANDAPSLITRLFFSAPSLTRDFTLTKQLSEALLWIADEKRRFVSAASHKISTEGNKQAPLLSENELRQALKWLSWYRGIKRVSQRGSSSRVSMTMERGLNFSDSSDQDFKKENQKQPNTVDALIASVTTKARTKKSVSQSSVSTKAVTEKQMKNIENFNNKNILTETTAVKAAVKENCPILQTPQRQTGKELLEMENLRSDSNLRQFDGNSNDGDEIENQGPNYNNEIDKALNAANSIHSGTSSTKEAIELLRSNPGFWKCRVPPKTSQLHHELNPWEPFSSLNGCKHASGVTVGEVPESVVQIFSDPFVLEASGDEVNCPQWQAGECENSSCSVRNDFSYDATSHNLNENTLDDVTLSDSPQAPSIESHGNPSSNNDSESIIANERMKHKKGGSDKKKLEIKNDNLREAKFKGCSPLVLLKIPKLEKKFQSKLPKRILKEIPTKPSDSNELKCQSDSAFKILNVPHFGKEDFISTETKSTQSMKLLEHAKVLGPDQVKSKKASLNLDRKIQTDAFYGVSNELISRGVQSSDEKSNQKEKSLQTSEINLEVEVGKKPFIRSFSSTHVQTCAVMEREALERSFLKDSFLLKEDSDSGKNDLGQNFNIYTKDKNLSLESTSDLEDFDRLQCVRRRENCRKHILESKIIEYPQQLTKDNSTQTSKLNILNLRGTSLQEIVQENDVTSFVEDIAEVPPYSKAITDQLGARNVAVDICQPIVDVFQDPDKYSHIIDIPTIIVKKQLEMLEGDLNQVVTNDMKKILFNNKTSVGPHHINECISVHDTGRVSNCGYSTTKAEVQQISKENFKCNKSDNSDSFQSKYVVYASGFIEEAQQSVNPKGDSVYSGACQISDMLQKTTNDIINMFMVGDISADSVCEFFKNSQLDISKAPPDTIGPHTIYSIGPVAKDSKGPSPKQRLQTLIQEANMTHEDIDDAKGFLSKVDVAIDSAIHQEAKQFDRIRMTAETSLTNQRSNDGVMKVRHNQDNDVISYFEQISPRNLNCLLRAVDEVFNIESPTTDRSTHNVQLRENIDTSGNFLQHSAAVASHDRSHGSPLLHLNLTCFGSEGSPTSPFKTDVSSSKTQRREEIRDWMKRKKLQRRKSENKEVRAERNEAIEKPCLTGRQIREINKTSKKKRIQRSEEYSRKRIIDVENLFRSFHEEKKTVLERPKSVSISQERLKEVDASSSPNSLLNGTQKIPKSKSPIKKLNRSSSTIVSDVEAEVERLQQLLSSDKIRKAAEGFLAKPSILQKDRSRRKANLTFVSSRSPYPLDRISEIDSENSKPSSPMLSLSSTDSSWDMPEDIKNILSKN